MTTVSFLSHEHLPDVVFSIQQSVIERTDSSSGIAKDDFYVLSFQTFNHSLTYSHLHNKVASIKNFLYKLSYKVIKHTKL